MRLISWTLRSGSEHGQLTFRSKSCWICRWMGYTYIQRWDLFTKDRKRKKFLKVICWRWRLPPPALRLMHATSTVHCIFLNTEHSAGPSSAGPSSACLLLYFHIFFPQITLKIATARYSPRLMIYTGKWINTLRSYGAIYSTSKEQIRNQAHWHTGWVCEQA